MLVAFPSWVKSNKQVPCASCENALEPQRTLLETLLHLSTSTFTHHPAVIVSKWFWISAEQLEGGTCGDYSSLQIKMQGEKKTHAQIALSNYCFQKRPASLLSHLETRRAKYHIKRRRKFNARPLQNEANKTSKKWRNLFNHWTGWINSSNNIFTPPAYLF